MCLRSGYGEEGQWKLEQCLPKGTWSNRVQRSLLAGMRGNGKEADVGIKRTNIFFGGSDKSWKLLIFQLLPVTVTGNTASWRKEGVLQTQEAHKTRFPRLPPRG